MPIRFAVYGLIAILVFGSIGVVGYRAMAPTSKTVVAKGGKQVVLYTDKPQIPLGGCSIWRVNVKAFYEQGFDLQGKAPAPEKEEPKK